MRNKKIIVGVTGSIAAYKSVELVRQLQERGADVRVVMSKGGEAFVTPLTFQAISGKPVHNDLLDVDAEAAMGHIELARWADLVLIAPASANCIARLAQGMADDLLSTLCLATEAKIAFAPAMNHKMWSNPATQANAALLQQRGYVMLGPDEGEQACGEVGAGRMQEPVTLAEAARELLGVPGPLSGKSVMVTAGPTLEDIDPVRFIGNRSSGKMGYAIAEAAAQLGARVTLVSGPVALAAPDNCERVMVRSAHDMHYEVMNRVDEADIFIAAAAVADYRPATAAEQKIKKDAESMQVELIKNPDILRAVAIQPDGPFCVGFAAETQDVERYARGKLESKKLDMICANLVGGEEGGFESNKNALQLYWNGGGIALPMADKKLLARSLMEQVVERYRQR